MLFVLDRHRTTLIDLVVQRALFLDEQKMTETERKNEQKDQHGTPEVRQERRRRMRESARSKRDPVLGNATMCFFYEDRAVGIEFARAITKCNVTLGGRKVLRRTQVCEEPRRLPPFNG
ncbi:MAG: EscU/YscU/HrcU family type III secretion system export apparatus switch protein [Litoreibacter sp.]